MKANSYISKREHKLLLAFAFVVFVLAFSSFASHIIESYNNSVSQIQFELKEEATRVNTDKVSFGIYSNYGTDWRLSYRFFIVLSFLFTIAALFKTKRFLLPSLFTSLSFFIFLTWFINFNRMINHNETLPPNFLERLLKIAEPFDYAVFLSVSILLFWQISILLRMLVKTSQKEKALP